MLVSSILCVVALLSSTVEAGPAAARRDDLETASSLSIGTPTPTRATLDEDALVVPLFDLDEEPAQARPSYLLLRPTTSLSLSFGLADASLPTNAPLLSVSPTLFITLAPALPQTPTPTSDPASLSVSLLLASPSAPPQQQEEEEEPTTTRAGVIASSLVGTVVGMGLLAVVWCLVRARVLKKRFKKERDERERERDLESEKGGEEMSLDLEEKGLEMGEEEVEVLEKLDDGEANVEVLIVTHSSPSIFSDSNTSNANALPLPPTSSPSLPDFSNHTTATPSLPSTTTPPSNAQSQSNKLTTPSPTAQSTSTTTSEGNHRTRTTTGSSGVTIDSYYTSQAVSPAFGTERWDGRPSTATSGSGMGRAV